MPIPARLAVSATNHHLRSLALALNDKLERLIRLPRSFSRFRYNFKQGVYTDITTQSDINETTNLSNVRVQSGNKVPAIEITTAFDAAPQILNYSTTGTTPVRTAMISRKQYKNGGNDYTNMWTILLWLPNAPAVTSFTLHFDATLTTLPFDLPFTFTVIADPEEGGD